MASNMDGEVVPSVDEQAFDPEPPTYDAAFPALPSESRHDRPLVNAGPWQPKFQSRSSRCTQVKMFQIVLVSCFIGQRTIPKIDQKN